MKLAQKMMLVPLGRTPIEVSAMSELDKAMSNVINNNNLSTLEKINLYSQILKRNFKFEENLKNNQQGYRMRDSKEMEEDKIKEEIKEEKEDDINTTLSSVVSMDVDDLNKNITNETTNFLSDVKREPEKKIQKTKKKNKKNFWKLKKQKKDSTFKTPSNVNLKWENLEPKKPPKRNVKKNLFDHNYPQHTYTNVGYSPDDIQFDERGNEYKLSEKNKRKVKS